MFDLSKRVAVVIGATSGIGRCLALGLAESGATVIPTGRRSNELKEVCEDLTARGSGTIYHVADVRDRSSLECFHAAVIRRFGQVDVLVNAAGYTFRHATASMREDQWAALLDTNVTGTLRGCQVFYESLRASGSGRIINIASLGAFVAFHEVAAYCASKAAVLSLTKSLACKWARDGICVNALAPGIIPTDLNDHIVTGTSRGGEMISRTPMRRFGRSEELLGAALLLASSGSSFLTGQCIAVDGGYLCIGRQSIVTTRRHRSEPRARASGFSAFSAALPALSTLKPGGLVVCESSGMWKPCEGATPPSLRAFERREMLSRPPGYGRSRPVRLDGEGR